VYSNILNPSSCVGSIEWQASGGGGGGGGGGREHSLHLSCGSASWLLPIEGDDDDVEGQLDEEEEDDFTTYSITTQRVIMI